MRPGAFGLPALVRSRTNARSCVGPHEQIPSAAIEPKPASDQAQRLRAALSGAGEVDSPRVLITGAKGGVGVTAIADALRPHLAPAGSDTMDLGRALSGPVQHADAWLLVVTPEPAALAAAFDAIRSVPERTIASGGSPLLVVNRSPSFACSRRAFERLGEALAGVGANGTVFAGHVPFDPAFARASGVVGGVARSGGPAARACREIARRLSEFLRPAAPGAAIVTTGARP